MGKQMKGSFIVFEGTEGAGKTTQAGLLKEWLEKRGYAVSLTREPTQSHVGQLINQILEKKISIAEEALPLLFAADRADHTIQHIIPKMEKETVVVCDRYIFSSLAYQGAGMGKKFSKKWLEEINKYSIRPDITFFLDIDSEEGLKRIGKGQRITDDKFFEDLETQKRIRNAYYDIFNLNTSLGSFTDIEVKSSSLSSRYKMRSTVDRGAVFTIDGTCSMEEIHKNIRSIVEMLLKNKQLKKKQQMTPESLFSKLPF
jgi:dTMP kinase